MKSKAIQSAHIHAASSHAQAKADAVEGKTEPTPGPWVVQPREGSAFAENLISTTDGRAIAMALCGMRGDFAAAEANARLLAAAPELLAALEALLKCCEAQPEWFDLTDRVDDAGQPFPSAPWIAARRAITKATGGTR